MVRVGTGHSLHAHTVSDPLLVLRIYCMGESVFYIDSAYRMIPIKIRGLEIWLTE